MPMDQASMPVWGRHTHRSGKHAKWVECWLGKHAHQLGKHAKWWSVHGLGKHAHRLGKHAKWLSVGWVSMPNCGYKFDW